MITIAKRQSNRGLIDLTPLIDIVFIVIVFLLLCMNSAIVELPFALPKDSSAALKSAQPDSELKLKLHANAPYFELTGATNERLNLDNLEQRLLDSTTQNSQPKVTIASDANTPIEPLVQLLALLNKHTIENTHILMEKH